MIGELFSILWAPFLMCLVLTGIHAYLGVHVLAREVVFVDIAMAQIAALGATIAFLRGYETDTWQSYAFALTATLLGAVVLALTRSRRRHVSQEAVIGVVYAVSSAAAVLLADRSPHGAEHRCRQAEGVRLPGVHLIAQQERRGRAERGDLRERDVDENDLAGQHVDAEVRVNASEDQAHEERRPQDREERADHVT